jgi:hypothetical protein
MKISPLQNYLDLQPYFAVISALQGSKIASLAKVPMLLGLILDPGSLKP